MDDPRTLHYTNLPPAEPGSMIAQEWESYRREVGRLLGEGQEGRFVLIKGEQIIGLFDTLDEAREAGARRYCLQAYLIQQVRTYEPLYYHIRYQPCPT